MLKKKIKRSAETSDTQNMGFFMKALDWFLKLFGIKMGQGAPFDDSFLEQKGNKELVKNKAREMFDHPIGKAILSMGLKIPGVATLVDKYLKQNPGLEKVAKEFLAENPDVEKHLSKDKNFMKTFSRLMPRPLTSEAARTMSAGATTSIEPEVGMLRQHAGQDASLQRILDEDPLTAPTSVLSPMPSTPSRTAPTAALTVPSDGTRDLSDEDTERFEI